MGFSRQKYWSGLPFPTPGDLCDPGIELMSPALAGEFPTNESPGKTYNMLTIIKCHPVSEFHQETSALDLPPQILFYLEQVPKHQKENGRQHSLC